MRLLTIIPARGGSKGIPGKNIKILGDKPLIAWSIDSIKKSNKCGDFYLNTEDDGIIEVAKSFGCSIYKRPLELAQDSSKSIDVVLEMLETLKNQGQQYDAICLVQATYPFREAGLLDRAIQKFEDTGADSLISVLPVPHHYNPHWVFETKDNFLQISTGEKSIIPRRQELPMAYHRDGAVYITKTEVILQKQSFFGEKLTFIETNPINYANIDTMEDWHLAEKYLENV